MGCVAIVGRMATLAPPVAPLMEMAQIPGVANGCVTPQATLKEDGVTVTPYLFRTSPLATDGAKALARYAYDTLGGRKVALLTEKTNIQCVYVSNAFREAFTALGGEIVGEEGYELEASEFRAQLTNIMQTSAEYLFMPAAAHKEVGNAAKIPGCFPRSLKTPGPSWKAPLCSPARTLLIHALTQCVNYTILSTRT